jgi:hypothetical protein
MIRVWIRTLDGYGQERDATVEVSPYDYRRPGGEVDVDEAYRVALEQAARLLLSWRPGMPPIPEHPDKTDEGRAAGPLREPV